MSDRELDSIAVEDMAHEFTKGEHLWTTELRANGEWQTTGRLTDQQIQAVTSLIDALTAANEEAA